MKKLFLLLPLLLLGCTKEEIVQPEQNDVYYVRMKVENTDGSVDYTEWKSVE